MFVGGLLPRPIGAIACAARQTLPAGAATATNEAALPGSIVVLFA